MKTQKYISKMTYNEILELEASDNLSSYQKRAIKKWYNKAEDDYINDMLALEADDDQ